MLGGFTRRAFLHGRGLRGFCKPHTEVVLSQILPLDEYKAIRPTVLKKQAELRKKRRVHVSI